MPPLSPDDYVSVAGTIDRDLPPLEELNPQWESNVLLKELVDFIRKNFSDEVSYEQVMERLRSLEASAQPASVAPSPVPVPGVGGLPEVGGGGEFDDFMDLKMDESVILNADMVSAALGKAAQAQS